MPDKKFLGLTILILIIIAFLPYLWAYVSKGDFYYTGLHSFTPVDSYVYYSYIEQAKNGRILLDIFFTNEAQRTFIFNPFWLLVGLTARILNLATPLAYHLFRLILIPLFLIVLYKVIVFFLEDVSIFRKRLCFLYAIFATGIGAFTTMIWPPQTLAEQFNLPMDVWVPESSNFLIMLNSPHLIASITLIILIFYFFFQSLEKASIKLGVTAGFLALILFAFHPFHILTIYFVSLIYLIILLVKKAALDIKKILNFALLVIISLPAVFYYLYIYFADGQIQNKVAQNTLLTPTGFNFFASFGFGLIMAILGIIYLINNKKLNNKNTFLLIWLAVNLLLLFGPYNFQRRLVEGLQIPLTLLAFIAMAGIYDLLKPKVAFLHKLKLWQIMPLFILLFCFSNVILYYQDIKFIAGKPEIIYLKKEVKQSLDWYKEQSSTQDTILASRMYGNIIPGLINRRVWLGHEVETYYFQEKSQKLTAFFQSQQDMTAKKEFLQNNNIQYIFYSQKERDLGDFDPAQADFLENIYANDQVTIFKVK